MKISLSKLISDERKEQKERDTLWAREIKTRDCWSCAVCGSDFKPNAHHIVPREQKEYRYCRDNGITLCVKHHKFCRTLSAHNNPFAFYLWLNKFRPELFDKAKERNTKILSDDGVLI